MIKVLILCDQELYGDICKRILANDRDIKIVGCSEYTANIELLCDSVLPDVILSTLTCNINSAADCFRKIKQKYKYLKIIHLHDTESTSPVFLMLDSDIDILLTKGINPSLLPYIIKNAAEGLMIVEQRFIRNLLANSAAFAEATDETACTEYVNWTDNEQSILNLIALGRNNKEIASAIHLSEGRIKNIITGILKKLGYSCRAQIAVYAAKNNVTTANHRSCINSK